MSQPERLQLSRRKGFDLQALSIATNGLPAVNCARPGRWGNPFKVGGSTIFGAYTQTPEVVVQRFREWLASDFLDAKEHRQLLPLLRGKNLACWCKLVDRHGKAEHCHADVLLEMANRPVCEAVG